MLQASFAHLYSMTTVLHEKTSFEFSQELKDSFLCRSRAELRRVRLATMRAENNGSTHCVWGFCSNREVQGTTNDQHDCRKIVRGATVCIAANARLLHEHARLTGLAQRAFLQIDPLHRVRGRHRALIVFAMGKVESVANLMRGFFRQPLAQEIEVWR